MKTIIIGLVAGLSFLLLAPLPSEACAWTDYEGFGHGSKERLAVEKALGAKEWKKALELLLSIESTAKKERDRTNESGRQQWRWEHEGWLHYQLATAYYGLGDNERAYRSIRKAVSVYTPRKKRGQIYLLFGNIQSRRGKLRDSVKWLRRAVRKRPKDPRYHATLGTVLERAGKLAGAERALAKAVALNPKHHGGMEWVHLELVRFKRQLKRSPSSHIERPFLHAYEKTKTAAELEAARRFARRLAPDLPIEKPDP